MILQPGYRMVEDYERLLEGDKLWYMPVPGWLEINSTYVGLEAGKLKEMIRNWWTGSLYFASKRPEPIVIGKLLEDLSQS